MLKYTYYMRGINLQTVVNCPQCGGNKIRSAKVLAKGFFWSGVVLCITIIGSPLGIILLLASLLVKIKKYHLKFYCHECKHEFKVSESLFKEYEKELKQKEEALS